ncbi:hypothetical protein ABI59_07330 [Acidobacteria bacterium Mor1]|nr:hypothetical protein ABI59_07330 [Acidobacteria bacterium Mor1]
MTRAERLDPIEPGLWHWSIHDERIDFRSEAYAVAGPEGAILIDPLPLDPMAAEALGPVQAICLTGGFHQRSAWRLQRELEVPVWAPSGARVGGRPDAWFGDGASLPGGLTALDRPGPTSPHFVLDWTSPGRRRVLFIADLLMRAARETFFFVPDDHQQDPARSRESVRRLLETSPDVLCPAHGDPEPENGRRALEEALAADQGRGGG